MTTILGLDLGKFKSVSCLYRPASQETRYDTIDTDPTILRRHLEHLRPDLVVFETCTVAGRVADTCDAPGIARLVADPMNDAWRWSKVRRETDRDDALKLARMAALGELPTAHVPSAEARQYRGLVAYRHRLVGRRTAIQNHIRALCQAHGPILPAAHRAWTRAGRQLLAELARPLDATTPADLRRGELALEPAALDRIDALLADAEAALDRAGQADERVRLLETIPGVGRRTAEVIAAYLDDPHRFRTAGEVSAYAGLVPRRFQSGQTDRHGRITRRGPRLLRAVPVESGWLVVRYNPWAARLFARLHRGQKARRKTAPVAVARKLLVRCWAMLRTGRPWRAEPEPAAA
jgi:transposase